MGGDGKAVVSGAWTDAEVADEENVTGNDVLGPVCLSKKGGFFFC